MDLSWFVTAVLGCIVLYVIYWLLTMNGDYWIKRGVPCVKSPPIIGIMSLFILTRKGLGEIMNDLYRQFDGHKFAGYFQFTSPIIMIRDPELINQVLIKDFTHFEDRAVPFTGQKDLFSLGLGNLTGNAWRNARHKLTPTFTSGKLKMMFTPIKECGDEVSRYLETRIGQDIEAKGLMLKYIINVIGDVAFGLKLDTLNEKDAQSVEFYKQSSTFFKPSFVVLMKLLISMSAPKLRQLLRLRLMNDGVEKFFRQLTHDVIKYREKNNAKRNDFLQLMLDLKKKENEILSNGNNSGTHDLENEPLESEDKELMDQLKNTPISSKESSKLEIFDDDFISSQTFLFISGGSETTATILTFILYELAVNQDLQKKVQDEIVSVISTHGFNYQSISKMTYMDQFINETFRLHPIGPMLMRICTKDYKLPGTDIIIEKGTFVSIPIGGLHKDPQYFPDPEKFDPDRFEDMEAIPKGVFFSFGGGPRICIAMRLAMLEMKIILAILLLNYTVTLSEKTKMPLKMLRNSVIVTVDGGVWIKFHKKNC